MELSGGHFIMNCLACFICVGVSGASLQYSAVVGFVVQGPHCLRSHESACSEGRTRTTPIILCEIDDPLIVLDGITQT